MARVVYYRIFSFITITKFYYSNNTSAWPSSATVTTNTASPSMASLEMDSTAVNQNPAAASNRVARKL